MTANTKSSKAPHSATGAALRLVLPVLIAGLILLGLGLALQPADAALASDGIAALSGSAKQPLLARPEADPVSVVAAAPALAPNLFGTLGSLQQQNFDASGLPAGATTSGTQPNAVYVRAQSPAGTNWGDVTYYMMVEVAVISTTTGLPDWDNAELFRSPAMSKNFGEAKFYPWTLIWGLETGKYYAWRAYEVAEDQGMGNKVAAATASLVVGAPLNSFNTVGALGGGTIYVITATDDASIVPDQLCSLREAVIASWSNVIVNECPAGHPTLLDVIVLLDDTYHITNDGFDVDTADIDFDPDGGPTLIIGAGMGETFIEVEYTLYARAFEVLPSDGAVPGWAVLGTVGSALTMQDLTISGGRTNLRAGDQCVAPPASQEYDGGALYNAHLLDLDGVRLTDNQANDGGAIYNTGLMNIDNSVIDNSHAYNYGASNCGGRGGGIFNTGNIYLTDSTITGNTADAPLGNEGGGGIYNTTGAGIWMDGAVITENTARAGGGLNNRGSVWVGTPGLDAGSTFDGNEAAFGGGIFNSGGLWLYYSTVSNNTGTVVGGGGAGVYALGGGLWMQNTTLSGNQAQGAGGGLWAGNGASIWLTHATVYNNVAGLGAPGYAGGGIFSNNICGAPAAGDPFIFLQNSIVAGNTSSGNLGAGNNIANTVITGGGNLVGVNNVGNFALGMCPSTPGSLVDQLNTGTVSAWTTDPKLGPLAENGGPTKTHMPLVLGLGNYSQAIDFPGTANIFSDDQRYFARPWDATNGVFGGQSDIGAVEFYGLLTGPGGPVYNATQGIAYPTLQLALDDASMNYYTSTQEIWVMVGVPQPFYWRDGTYQIGFIDSPVHLMGGWNGAFPGEIFSGDTLLDANGDGRHFKIVGDPLAVTIENFNLREGDATQGNADGYGGSIAVYGSDLTLLGSILEGNYAAYGGAISLASYLYVDSTSFITNTAEYGGAIYAEGEVDLVYVDFLTNTATWEGGAFYLETGDLLANAINARANSAGINGGAFFLYEAKAPSTFDWVNFRFNDAAAGDGGAIFNAHFDTLVVTGPAYSEFYTNTAGYDGGAIYSDLPLSLTNVEMYQNTADEEGGAVKVDDGQDGLVTILASLFTENAAFGTTSSDGDGGAVYASGDVMVTGSTFTENAARLAGPSGGEGGAIYSTSGNEITILDSYFYDNAAYDEGGAIQADANIDESETVNIDVTFKITNTYFEGNYVINDDGGAVQMNLGVMYIWDSEFFTNSAQSDSGGAVGVDVGNIEIYRSQFCYNTAAVDGGAVWVRAGGSYLGTAYIEDSYFCENVAGISGGGAWVDGATTIVGTTALAVPTGAPWTTPVGVASTIFELNEAQGNEGGGVYVNNGTLTITNTQFLTNTADEDGGGAHVEEGDAYIYTSMFIANEAATDPDADGGGLSLEIGSAWIWTTWFERNNAEDEGGGARILNGDLYLDDVTFLLNTADNNGGGAWVEGNLYDLGSSSNFILNTADNNGGGAFVDDGDARLHLTIFYTNTALNNDGGGLMVNSGSAYLTSTEFVYNEAEVHGGGAYVSDFTQLNSSNLFDRNVALTGSGGGLWTGTGLTDNTTDSHFYDNEAEVHGGGAYVDTGDVNLLETDFERNSAYLGSGGGLYVNDGNLTSEDTRFIDNFADVDGGGAFVNGNLDDTNSLFQDNYAGENGGGAYITGSSTIDSTNFFYNIADTGSGGGLWSGLFVDDSTSASEFRGNTAYYDGGGAYVNSGNATLNLTMFYTNTAGYSGVLSVTLGMGSGGGLYVNNGNLQATSTVFYTNTAWNDGGGAYVSNATTLISQNIFQYNTAGVSGFYSVTLASGSGGGLWTGNTLTDMTSDSQFVINTAWNDGGGAYVDNGDVALNLTDFLTNTAGLSGVFTPTIGFGSGGGLYVNNGDLDATSANWEYNWAFDDGGGAYVDGDTRLHSSNNFAYNLAFTGSGGGLYTTGYLQDIDTNSQFVFNTAAIDGGGAWVGAQTELIDTDFLTNTAGFDGGGLFSTDYLTATDATWVDNVAGDDGGGAYVETSGAWLLRGTFTTNTAVGSAEVGGDAGGDGGGLWADSYLTATLTTWYTNTAEDDGGGGYISAGNAWLYDAYFQDNYALGADTTGIADEDGDGGGLYVGGSAWSWGTEWVTNAAEDNGGGAYIEVDFTTEDNFFDRNNAGALVLPDVNEPTEVFYGDGGGAWVGNNYYDTSSLYDRNIADFDGGGTYVTNAATLTSTVYQYNTAAGGDGGGLWAYTAWMTDTLYLDNLAGDDGGGAYVEFYFEVYNSEFITNLAGGREDEALGGGLASQYGGIVEGSTFTENTATSLGLLPYIEGAFGGGIYVREFLYIYTSTVELNTARGNNAAGGGIAVSEASPFGGGGGTYLYMENTEVLTNTAENAAFPLFAVGPAWGGGVYVRWGDAYITTSHFIANEATDGVLGGNGGGLVVSGFAQVFRTEFLRNSATSGGVDSGGFGGAAYISGGPFGSGGAYFENVIAAGNLAVGQEGHAYVFDGVDGLVLHNTIAGTPPLVPSCGCISEIPLEGSAIFIADFIEEAYVEILDTIITSYTVGIRAENVGGFGVYGFEDWNLFYDVATPVIGLVPGVNSFVGNPHFADPLNDDFHILPPSEAIDAGDYVGVDQDYDYIFRPQGPAVDIGAYELAQVVCAYPDTGCHFHVYLDTAVLPALLTIDVYTSTAPAEPYVYVDLAETHTYINDNVYALLLTGSDMTDSVKVDNTNGDAFPYGAGVWFMGLGEADYTVLTGTVAVMDVVYDFDESVTGSITGTATTDEGTLHFFSVEGDSFDFLDKETLTLNYNVPMNNIHIGDARPGAHAVFTGGYGTFGDDFSRVTPTAPLNSFTLFLVNPTDTVTFNGSSAMDMFMNHGLDNFSGEYYYNGLGGDDQLWQFFGDLANVGHIFGSASYFDGGDEDPDTDGDFIRLSHGSFISTTHNFIDPASGNVLVAGVYLHYTGLEPILDQLTVADRNFNFITGLGDDVYLGDDAVAGDNMNEISSNNSETVTFLWATNSVNVYTLDGDDDVVVMPFDSASTVDVDFGDPTSVNIWLGDGNDTLLGDTLTSALSVWGQAGKDVIETGSGNDFLADGSDDDELQGNAGHDWYQLTPGSQDLLIDPSGHDTLDFSGASLDITIDMDKDTMQILDVAGNTITLIGRFEDLYATNNAGGDTATIKVLADDVRYADGNDPVVEDTDWLWVDADGLPVVAFVETPGNVLLPNGDTVPYDGYVQILGMQPVYFYDWADVWIINTTADLELLKTGPLTATAGTEIVYTVVITNKDRTDMHIWPVAAEAATFQDNPASEGIVAIQAAYQRSTSMEWIECADMWSCDFGEILYGEVITLTLTGLVDPAMPIAYQLINEATVFATNTHVYEQADDTDSWTTTVETRVSLGVEKQSLNDTIVAGGAPVLFTISVWNDGPSNAYNVQVTDTPALSFTLVSDVEPAQQSAMYNIVCSGGVCTIPVLPAGASVELYAQLEASSDIYETMNLLANSVCISGVTATYVSYNPRCDDETINVVDHFDLEIVKVATDWQFAGEYITYTLYVSNNGPSDVWGFSLRDQLPTLPTNAIISVVSAPGWNQSLFAAQRILTYNETRRLPAGEMFEYTIVVDTNPNIEPGTSLENVATITGWNPSKTELFAPNNTSRADTSIVALADLDITKTGPDTIVAGTEIQYTITVTNTGPSKAHSVVMVDNLPDEVIFIDATVNLGACDNSTCQLGDMEVNAVRTITIRGLVRSDVASGVTLTNVATAFSDSNYDADPTEAVATWDTDVTTEAWLYISKDDEGNSIMAGGDPINYYIVVWNDGPSDAYNVVITDAVQAGFVLNSDLIAGDQYEGMGITCTGDTCTIDQLPAGEDVLFIATVTALSSTEEGADVEANEACIASYTADVKGGTWCDLELTDVLNEADLVLNKTATPTTTAGRTIDYVLTVTNAGPSDATDIVIVDTLPVPVVFESASPACIYNAGTVTCSLAYLDVFDTASFTITVTVNPDVWPGTSLHNSAVVTADEFDPDLNNNEANADTSVLAESNLTLVKTGPATVVAGTEMTYQIVVTNEGPSDARDVTILDDLADEHVSLVSASLMGNPCSGATCEYLGQLAAGDKITMTVTVFVHSDVESGTMIYNTATADTDSYYDTNTADNSMTIMTEVETQVTLNIAKEDVSNEIVAGGDAAMYIITVYNAGPSDTSDVVVVDTPQTNFSLVGDLTAGNQMISCAGNTCTISYLAVGESVELYALVKASPSTPAGVQNANQACITSFSADIAATVPANGCDMETTVVVTNADLSLGKMAPATVFAGEYMTYTLVAYNNGPSDALMVTVMDMLPEGVTYVSSAGAVCMMTDVQEYTCSLGTLAAKAFATFTIKVMVDADIEPGVSLENYALITSMTPDSDLFNNAASADTSVVGLADLQLDKDGPDTVVAGELITYTITVYNDGPSDAQAVDIKDDLPEWISLVSATVALPGAEGPVLCGGTVCQVGDLPAGATATVTIVGMVDASTPEGEMLVNHAAVFSATDDEMSDDNHDMVETEVETVADVVIEKVALTDPVAQGAFVLYEIHVENYGPSDAQDVVVTDIIPAGLTFVSISPSSGCTYLAGTVTCTIPTLAAGAAVDYMLVAMVDLDVFDNTVITNTATVASDTFDPMADNNTSSDSFTVYPILRETDLSVTKTATPNVVAAGEEIAYEIIVTNHGPSRASSVELIENLPAGVTVISMVAYNPDDEGTQCDEGGECHLGTMEVGTVATINLIVKVDAGMLASTLINGVTVFANEPDPDRLNNYAEAIVTVMVDADLSISKSDSPDYVEVGEKLIYTITVTNNGPSAVRGIKVTDMLPEEVTFIAISSDEDCVEAYDADWNQTGVITCDVDDLAAGETDTIVLEVLVTDILADMTMIYNTACVAGDRPDLDSSNDCTTIDTTVRSFADLRVTKTANKDEVLKGMPIEFYITVRNLGPHIAVNATLEDVLPGNMVFINAGVSQGSCSHDMGTVSCDFGHLLQYTEANGWPEVYITLRVYANDEGTWTNYAVASSESFDEDPDNSVGSATVTVIDERQVYSLCFNDNNLANDDLSKWFLGDSGRTLADPQLVDVYQNVTPLGDRNFMGEFGKRTVTDPAELARLVLTDLPEHKRVRIEFTLFVIKSWDGNTIVDPFNPPTIIGPDIFKVTDVNSGEHILHTTFTNWQVNDEGGSPLFYQAYPAAYPEGTYNPQAIAADLSALDYTASPAVVINNAPFTGSAERNTLGYYYRGIEGIGPLRPMDSVYKIGYRDTFYLGGADADPLVIFNHTASDLTLEIGAPDLQGRFYETEYQALVFDESWGIECFNVYVQGTNLLYTVYLPIVVR